MGWRVTSSLCDAPARGQRALGLILRPNTRSLPSVFFSPALPRSFWLLRTAAVRLSPPALGTRTPDVGRCRRGGSRRGRGPQTGRSPFRFKHSDTFPTEPPTPLGGARFGGPREGGGASGIRGGGGGPRGEGRGRRSLRGSGRGELVRLLLH